MDSMAFEFWQRLTILKWLLDRLRSYGLWYKCLKIRVNLRNPRQSAIQTNKGRHTPSVLRSKIGERHRGLCLLPLKGKIQ